MKSGTSFLQSVLAGNYDRLRAAGVEFADGRSASAGRVRMARPHRAAEEVLHGNRGYAQWEAVRAQLRVSPCETAVMSSELFSFLDRDGARRVVDALADVELTVVVTVRDQFRVIPAQWQTFTRNFGLDSFEEYARRIAADPPARRGGSRAYRTFHRAQGVRGIVERWAVPGVDRVALVTVPPSSASGDVLWRRFADAGGFHVEDIGFDEVADNQSVGYAACEYLRRANAMLADLPGRRYRGLMRPVARQVLAPLRAEQGRPVLDVAAAEFARERNQRGGELLSSPRYPLFGDVDDVPVPETLDGFSDHIVPPVDEQVRDSAAAVHVYAAERSGVNAPDRPDDLEELIADGVRLLRDGSAHRGTPSGKAGRG